MGEITLGLTNINLMSSRGLDLQTQLQCNYTNSTLTALNFFNCSLNHDIISFFIGGLPEHFHTARAMTINNNVFISSEGCLSVEDLVHELAHVWQFQKRLWFGRQGIPQLVRWLNQQVTNRTGIYNYGGEKGLELALAEGKTFLDFNFEQQASIVQDYYASSVVEYPEKWKILLEHFSGVVMECF